MGVMKRLSEQMRTPKRKNSILGARDGLPFEISLESVSAVARYERRQDKEKLKQFNDDVDAWRIDITRQLRGNVRILVKQDEVLSSSIDSNVHKEKGEPDRLGFSFAREGIYIHKGAGRGQGGFRGGSKWTDRHGKLKKTNPESFYKMGTGNRTPIRWFDPVIDRNLPALADLVAEYAADMQIDASRIFIDRE